MGILVFIAGGLLLDQLIKIWAGGFLTGAWGESALLSLNPGYEGYTVPLIKNVFHLTYVENRGAAFGMFENRLWIFIMISGIAFIGLLYILLVYKPKTRIFKFSLAIMAIGAGGNLIDRIFRGYVIDYVDVRFVNFAVFNFADICVSVSAVLLLGCLLFLKSEPILSEMSPVEEEKILTNGSARVEQFEIFNKDDVPLDEADDDTRVKIIKENDETVT